MSEEGKWLRNLAMLIIALPFIFFCLQLLWLVPNWLSRATTVVQEQVDPAVLLKKYEWFKDASAALDKKLADVKVYDQRLKSIESVPREEWHREDREQYYVWLSESAGIKASYNQLASEYNSQMAKINWRFTNVGMLPAGATEPLPKEYKPYEVQ